MSEQRIGIALGGGGAKGLSHLAFLEVLDELGVRPAVVSGTSIGAIVGAFHASGRTAREILELVAAMDFGGVVRMLDLSLRGSALLKGRGVEAFFADHLPGTFEELEYPLRIVASDYWRRSPVVFDSGELVRAVRASMALPGIFEPVPWEGSILVDGGLVNPLPFDLIRAECDTLVAIDVSGVKEPDETDEDGVVNPGLFELLASSVQIASASIVDSKLELARPDILVRPQLRNVRVLDFDDHEAILASVSEEVASFRARIEEALAG